MKKNRKLVIFIIIFLLFVLVTALFLLQKYTGKLTKTQIGQADQQQNPPANSPEGVTRDYYNWYASCLKEHPQDLKNATALKKDCPLHGHTGVSNNFANENDLHYTDQVLCDEGIPKKMAFGKAYIGATHTASVDVTTFFKDYHYAIPVALRKENGTWKIFRIDCDLDGHID